MRIGMFTNTYLPIISGVVRSVTLYRQGLSDAGHWVGVFTSGKYRDIDVQPFVFRYPMLQLPFGYQYTIPITISSNIKWVIPRVKLDIVHAHHPILLGNVACYSSDLCSVPLIFTFHTLYHEYVHYFGFETFTTRKLVRRAVGKFAAKADRIIVPSRSVIAHLPSYGIERDVDVLPTPIDLTRFASRPKPPMWDEQKVDLIYVGRLAKEKNIDFLLRAFAYASQEDHRLHLRIVGYGPHASTIRELVKKLNLQQRVTFVGAVPFEDVANELLAADIFVFPSLTETQGLVVQEAMAACLPAILLDSPVWEDFAIQDHTCLIVPKDEREYAHAILLLARDRERAMAMGAHARAQAEFFGVTSLSKRLVDIYEAAISDYHRRKSGN